MNKYYYDFRDIFRAPRIALHGKNIYLQMRNLLIGYVGYAVIAYLALLVEGVDLRFAWDVHFIFPIGTLGLVTIWGKLVWLIALHWFIICLLRGNLAVSKSAYEEIKGNLFFSSSEARTFVKEKKWIMFRAYVSVVAFIIFMIALGLIAGLIGKIPVVGELSFGLFYGFPYFILSLFAVLIMFLFTTFTLTGPAAVGVKGEDTLTTLFDGLSVVTSRPLRWTIYTTASVVIAKVCSFALFYFSFRAIGDRENSCEFAGHQVPQLHLSRQRFRNQSLYARRISPVKHDIFDSYLSCYHKHQPRFPVHHRLLYQHSCRGTGDRVHRHSQTDSQRQLG
jgi:hypothetical protein